MIHNNKIFYVLLLYIGTSVQGVNQFDIFKKENLVLETPRLILRLLDPLDLYDVFEFTSDTEVEKLTGMFSLHANYRETSDFIYSLLDSYKNYTSIPWAIVYKLHNKVIGILRFFTYSLLHHKAEVGYVISAEYWGRGIATESLYEVLKFGFEKLDLQRIQATADPRNIASCRVLEKCGFQYEGLLRDYYFLRGEFCNRSMFSLLKSDW